MTLYPIQNNETITAGSRNLFILLNGSVTIDRDNDIHSIPAKSYFFFDVTFDIIAASPFVEGFVAKLSDDDLSRLSDLKEGLSSIPADFSVLRIKNQDDKKGVIKSMLEANGNERLHESYTHVLWNEFIKDYKDSQDDKSTVEQFSELIDQNIEQNYCAGTYAEMMGIPLKKLIKEVRISENKTPCSFITEKVIDKAKYKLLNTEDTSQMIAYQLGFEDPYYFIKYFKKNTNQTPTQFRAQHAVISS